MVLLILTLLVVLTLLRIWSILPHKTRRAPLRSSKPTRSLAAFLGSGGHTSEMVQLLRSLDFARYTPRIYILSRGDHLSTSKANELELSKSAVDHPLDMRTITLSRAREIRQSLFTTQFSALKSLVHSLIELSLRPALRGEPLADLLLLNGPGTCVAIVGAVYVNRFLGLPTPRLIYIESFTRVKDVSLSGRLLRPFVDRFIVQWPQLLNGGMRGEYHGWLNDYNIPETSELAQSETGGRISAAKLMSLRRALLFSLYWRIGRTKVFLPRDTDAFLIQYDSAKLWHLGLDEVSLTHEEHGRHKMIRCSMEHQVAYIALGRVATVDAGGEGAPDKKGWLLRLLPHVITR